MLKISNWVDWLWERRLPKVRGRRLSIADRARLAFEPLEDRRLLAVLISDDFNRADATKYNLGQADLAFGGSGAHYYLPIFPTGGTDPSNPIGASIVSGALRNNGLDYGGVQFTASSNTAAASGQNVGQDLTMAADITVPTDGAGHVSEAGLYFRGRSAFTGDGIIGGSSSGYWVQLRSTGEVRIKYLNNVSGTLTIPSTGTPASFDPTVPHHLEVFVHGTYSAGAKLQVVLDGNLQTFTQNGNPVTTVTLADPGGSNDGTAGVAFSDELNRGTIGGQRADNVVVASYSAYNIVVSGSGSAAETSLRNAIALANADSAHCISHLITFDPSLNGSTITLTQGQLELTAGTGTVTIDGGNQITINGNSASRDFRVDHGAHVVLNGLTITGGNADFGQGGGIENSGALSLIASTVTGNVGYIGGGIDNETGGTLTVTNSTICNNQTTENGAGGGLANLTGASAALFNSTLAGNVAFGFGGGIFDTGVLSMTNGTIAGNQSGEGGGIFDNEFDEGFTRSVTLVNTLVAGNADFQSSFPDISGPVTADYSLIGNTTGATISNAHGGHNILNPTSVGLSTSLADNGGPTHTLALLSGSPAINAGSTSLAVDVSSQPLTTDQRGNGFARVLGASVDIGALESHASGPVVTTNSDSASHSGTSLRDAIAQANNDAGNGISDQITFASNLNGSTISLSQGQLELTSGSGTITINGGNQITVSGNNTSRVFKVDSGANVVLSGMTISGGNAGQYGEGGGIDNAGNLTVTDSTITNNVGYTGAGVGNEYGSSVSLSVINSTIANNHTTPGGAGGGLALIWQSNARLFNTTVANNTSYGFGPGIFDLGNLTVINSTVAYNSSIYNDGGIFDNEYSGSPPNAIVPTATLVNTIVVGNGVDLDGPMTVDYSLIGNASKATITNQSGGHNIINPSSTGVSTALANNGGPTQSLALLTGSPAINAGSTSLAVDANGQPLTTDQRGAGYLRDFGSAVDIGAFEAQTPSTITINFDQFSTGVQSANFLNAYDIGTITWTGTTGTQGPPSIQNFGSYAPSPPMVLQQSDSTPYADNPTSSDDTLSIPFIIPLTSFSLSRIATPQSNSSIPEWHARFYNSAGTLLGTFGESYTVAQLPVQPFTFNAPAGQTITRMDLESVFLYSTYRNIPVDNFQLTLANGTTVSPTVTAPANQTATTGIAQSIDLGSFVDPDGGPWNVDVNWGDGSTDTTFSTLSAGALGAQSHTYTTSGSKTATVTVADATGTGEMAGTASFQVGIANSLVVTTTSDGVNHSGVSLRDAIAQANALAMNGIPEQITFAAGLSGTIMLSQGQLELTAGTGIVTIDGGNQITVDGNNASRVFQVDAGADVVFSGLTIQGGNALGGDGGGINAGDINSGLNATVTLNQVTVRNNVAGRGAGINIQFSSSAMVAGTLTINNSTITGNQGTSRGGGINVGDYGTLYMTGATVSNNSTTEHAGGIALHIVTSGYISNSTISGNNAGLAAGGILTFGGTNPLVIVNSTISGNTATDSAGGIYADADLKIINSTITANNAGSGEPGGGFTIGGQTHGAETQTLYNTIVAGNFAGTTPSDVEPISGLNDTIDVASNDLIGNAATRGGIVNGTNGNIVGNAGSGTIDINTVLNTTLANNGGPTMTHALVNGSPAINAGNTSLAVDANNNPLTTDQRGAGYARVVGSAVDLGAVEALGTAAAIVTAPASQIAATGISQTFSLGSFSDADGGPWNVDVNWGDGTTDSTFSASSAGSLGALSHTYATAGIRSVTVTVTDTAGLESPGVATFRATTTTSPSVTPPANQTSNVGISHPFNLGSFSDPDGVEWNVDVHWGDGSGDSFFEVHSTGSLGTLSHTYTTSGTSTVTVTVTDATSGAESSGVASYQVMTASPPTLDSISNPSAIFENAGQQAVNLTGIGVGAGNDGQSLTVTATSSNPGLIPNPTVMYVSPNATGSLTYTPNPFLYGTATITVTVQHSGGGSTQQTFTVTVTQVHQAPTGANHTVTTLEDTPYALKAADFGFSDPLDSPPDSLQAVEITTLPMTGQLTDHGSAVIAGQFVSAADINSGSLLFIPDQNGFGAAYGSFTSQVQDTGGIANGGVDLDPIPKTLTINVTPVNDRPTFSTGANQFGIDTAGSRTIPNWATALSAGPANESGQALNFIVNNNNSALFTAQPAISPNGTLTYTPAPGHTGMATVFVKLHDDGGTSNGGFDTSPTQSFSITIGSVDRFEPDNLFDTAANVGVAPGIHLNNLTVDSTTDQDWYRFQLLRSDSLNVSISFERSAGDLNLEVRDANNQIVGIFSTPTNQDLVQLSQLAAGTYYVHVSGVGQQINAYSLSIDPSSGSTTRVFYVNDASTTNDFYAQAPGDDVNNDGLTPATPKATVQSVLANYSIGPTDLILVDTGVYTSGVTIDADHKGAAYAGSPGGSTFQNLGTAFNLVDADFDVLYGLEFSNVGLAIYAHSNSTSNSTNNIFQNNTFMDTGTAIRVDSGVNYTISGNTIFGGGSFGIQLYSPGGQFVVSGNTISSHTYGVYSTGSQTPFSLQIGGSAANGNTITGGVYGIQADEDGVDIENNVVSGASNQGIASYGAATIRNNTVSQSGTGISAQSFSATVSANVVHDNQTGITGWGIFGGTDWTTNVGNDIYNNITGIVWQGTNQVAFNRIHDNSVGISVSGGGSQRTIAHNVIYGNSAQGVLLDNASSIQIVSNTIYAPTGDAVRIRNSSSTITLENNILWVQAGYDIYVSVDSQQGFASDYNNLFASASGKPVWWQKDFGDIFDWRVEARYDLHSIGYTTVNPTLDNPQFVNVSGNDFHLTDVTSASIDAGDPASSFSLEPGTNGGRIDLGAYGNTAQAAQSVSSYIKLDYPNYYADWEVNVGHAILWHTYHVASDANVNIDVYQQGSSTPLAHIATVAASTGSYGWSPSANGITGSVSQRYFIRVSLAADVSIRSDSREVFSVPTSGNQYYINDSSTTGDQYTTAVGSNRNTGKTPGDPKANLLPMLGAYALGPANTVYIDTGNYIHVRNVIISADTNIGSGAGTTFLGPTNSGAVASIDRANTSAGTVVIDVNDGSFTTIANLTLHGAQSGLLVHNGSTHFSGSMLTVTANTGDGLILASDATGSLLDTITATNNGGTGINVAASIATLNNTTASNNGGTGIYVTAPITSVQNTTATNNGGNGIILGAAVTTVSYNTATNNGGSGIAIGGAVTTVSHNTATNNSGPGISLSNSGNAVVENNVAYGNDSGISVSNGVFNTTTVIGNTDLSLGKGNLVYNNRSVGIGASGGVVVAGNTAYAQSQPGGVGISLFGSTATNNVTYGNYRGIVASFSTITGNRIYDNSQEGIQASGQTSIQNNVIYSNAVGVSMSRYDYRFAYAATITNNLIYANLSQGLIISGAGSGTLVSNNTFYLPNGDGVHVSGSYGIKLRNNIIWVQGGYALNVDADSQNSFDSNFNDLYATGSGRVALWQGVSRSTLTTWQNSAFDDLDSLNQDPLFVNATGADGILGFGDTTNDGRDDDFHERSQFGTFTGGALAPVIGPSGLPVSLTPVVTTYTAQSPTIDRGDFTSDFSSEPTPNGNFINLGAYGNTAQASESPTEYVLITRPGGGETWPASQTFSIRWRTQDLGTGTGTADIDLLTVGNSTPVLSIASGVANSGSFSWSIPSDLTPGTNYQIRVTHNSLSATSNTFATSAPITQYYVNDGTFASGDFTTAAGDDGNDGFTPATPMASIAAVFQKYQLGTGNIILVDEGTYNLGTNIVIPASASGVTIRGFYDSANPSAVAVLDRGNTNGGSYAIQLAGATSVTLDHLSITDAYIGIEADNGVASTGLIVTNSKIFGNSQYGIYLASSNDQAQITGNEFSSNQSAGISLSTNGNVVTANTMHGASGGIAITGGQNTVSGNTMSDNSGIGINGNQNSVSGNTLSGNGGIGINGSQNSISGNTASGGSISVGGSQNTISNNTVHDGGGIGVADYSGVAGSSIVSGNTAYNNGGTGISAYSGVLVTGNTVYGQTGYNNAGIRASYGAQIVNNIVYGNTDGIDVDHGGWIHGNRIYNNSGNGIATSYYYGIGIDANTIYSNAVGVVAASTGLSITNNLIYANTSEGIAVYVSPNIANNTIYQTVGDAIVVASNTPNVRLRNNILWVQSGYDLNIDASSEVGFDSDYNDLYATGTGNLVHWGATTFTNRADWFYELGQDPHSLSSDPLFVNPAGPDGKVGYQGGVDYGQDDNFLVQANSPTIDAGDLTSYYLAEPEPNGGRVNLGHTGNTAQATVSPAQTVQILSPNGLEKFQAGQQVPISWRSSGLTLNHPVALINAGGSTVDNWLVDTIGTGIDGTSSVNTPIDTSGVSDPAPQAVYQSYASSFGTMTYSLPVPDGAYTVRLHFSEPSCTGPGQRLFDIQINGATVQSSYDIFAAAGAMNKATTLSYSVQASGSHGLLLQMINRQNWALLSGIELTEVNPDGVASPSVNLDYSPDGGMTWSSITTGLSMDVYGRGAFNWTIPNSVTSGSNYLVRATANDGSQPQDVSNDRFSIANVSKNSSGGYDYYVNDVSTSGDIFTTAVGNNTNTGTSPDQPMASLAAVLSAYSFTSADTIFVDAGTYTPVGNIRLTSRASGVHIQGPSTATALVDRSGGAYAFEFAGATNVTLAHLSITGAGTGVFSPSSAPADGLTIDNDTFFAGTNTQVSVYGQGVTVQNSTFAIDQTSGIFLVGSQALVQNNAFSATNGGGGAINVSSDDAIIRNNTITNVGSGIGLYGLRGLVTGNTLTNAFNGMQITAYSSAASDRTIVSGNLVTHTSGFSHGTGIYGDRPAVYVANNTVYGYANGTGIYLEHGAQAVGNTIHDNSAGITIISGGQAIGNTVYGNAEGIYSFSPFYSSTVIRDNRVFHNSDIGIQGYYGATIAGNTVYASSIGIAAGGASVTGNLVYGNSNEGLQLGGDVQATGNTIFQIVGDGIWIRGGSIKLRNNIVWVQAGYDLNIDTTTPAGFDSDYNDLYTTVTGNVARWGTHTLTTRADWFYEVGLDLHSLSSDPLFVNLAGADGLLGFQNGNDYGADDNLQVQTGSPTIDAGDPASYYLSEPAPNGGRVNLGYTGNTPQAVASGAQTVQVLSPLGLQKFQLGQQVAIQWQSSGLGLTQPVALINVGGPTIGNWLTDAYQTQIDYANQSYNSSVDTTGVTDPAPAGVYQSFDQSVNEVGSVLAYTLPIPDGTYNVRLHFAEPYFNVAGQRSFDIRFNSTTVQSNYDIFAAAGALHTAAIYSHSVDVTGSQGLLIELVNETGGAILSGIEVTRATAGVPSPTVNLDYSADGGSTWGSIATGLAMDAYGRGAYNWTIPNNLTPGANYLVRATANDGSHPQGVSAGTFWIANAGHSYYVNDGDATNDVFTTAVGNNANSGKSPDQPMASMAGLLSVYSFTSADMIYVDTGSYTPARNILLTSRASGVRIQGPSATTALFDRGDVNGTFVFQLTGATNVTLDHISITGASVGVETESGSTNLTVSASQIYGNSNSGIVLNASNDYAQLTGNTIYGVLGSFNTRQPNGIRIASNNNVIAGNIVHDSSNTGIAADDYPYNYGENTISGNTIYNNGTGISIDDRTGNSTPTTVSGNIVYNNGGGISALYNTLVTGNTVYGQSSQYAIGINLYFATATGNLVYGNYDGITGYGSAVRGNRVLRNSHFGIGASNSAISGNTVYSNLVGITGDSNSTIFNNLVYANANQGLSLSGNTGLVSNNTVYQIVGDAIQLQVNTAKLRNNILWVEAGYDLNFIGYNPSGLDSDYNLFFKGTDPNAHVGFFTTTQDTFAAWQTATGKDVHSQFGDPKFVDINGADNVLGYSTDLTYDGGRDDNFQLSAGSPAIDAGDSWSAAPNDILGASRGNDPGTTVKLGTLDYAEGPAAGAVFSGSPVGVAQNWHSSDAIFGLNLPFSFPFYNATYNSVYVSTEGFVQFGGYNPTGSSNSVANLAILPRIAPLWANLRTDGAGDDIFVDTSHPDQVTIRWRATNEADGGDVNFAVTLFSSGNIRFDYGAGNANLSPTIGISSGNGVTYQLSKYNGRTNLASAASVQFNLQPGITDPGAFEFRGSSLDTTPPTVLSTSPPGINASASAVPRVNQIGVTFSEPLDAIDANAPANFELRAAGADGVFNTGDDTLVAVTPVYTSGSTTITLNLGSTIPVGLYRLIVKAGGTSAIHDLAGLSLDGDADGTAGGDYVRTFTVTNIQAQTINFPTIADRLYGDTFALSATASSGLDVTFSVLAGPASIVGNTLNVTGVGTVTVEALQSGNGSFAAATVDRSFMAAPASLLIMADDQSKFYGAPLPMLTVSYLGFVNGDTAASLSAAPLVSTTATDTSPVGTYPITANNAVDPNYLIGYADGTLTITATLVVASLTPTTSGFVATFGQAFDPTQLNLYASYDPRFTTPDVTLVGNTVGNIQGSLVVDSSNAKITFVKTGLVGANMLPMGNAQSLLPPDTYTVRLASGAHGFVTPGGTQLDGNSDGTPGDDYLGTFTVGAMASGTVVASLPSFARGPDNIHVVNVPNNPIAAAQTIAFGGTITGGTFRLSLNGQQTSPIAYDPSPATLADNIRSALAALPVVNGTGNVTVGTGPFTVTFVGVSNPGLMSTVNSLTGVNPTVTTSTTPGYGGIPLDLTVLAPHQTITIGPGATSGSSFRLSFNGLQTSNIVYSNNLAITQANIRNALSSLANVGPGNVVVVGVNPFSVIFSNAIYNPNLITVAGASGSFTGSNPVGITIVNADAAPMVSNATFTLDYNADLLNITGGIVNPDLPAVTGAMFSVMTSGSGANAQATITFTTASGALSLGSLGSVRLGSLVATVPSLGAAANYTSKELLHFDSTSTINNETVPVTTTDAVHVDAYVGDTNADAKYTSADYVGAVRVINSVITGIGLANYPLADPVLIADPTNIGFVNATDAALIFRRGGGNMSMVQFPPYVGFTGTPGGLDPTLSIPTNLSLDSSGTAHVPVNIDDPRPVGSAGLASATLAIKYDPTVFTVSASDIHLGAVPSASGGWSVQSMVDQATGQIGVMLFGVTPITSTAGGSLVTIDFHRTNRDVQAAASLINLAAQAQIPSYGTLETELDGVEGRYILGPAPTDASNDPSVDGSVLLAPVANRFVQPLARNNLSAVDAYFSFFGDALVGG